MATNDTILIDGILDDIISSNGMDEHVAKPVDVELLIKVIHKLVKYN